MPGRRITTPPGNLQSIPFPRCCPVSRRDCHAAPAMTDTEKTGKHQLPTDGTMLHHRDMEHASAMPERGRATGRRAVHRSRHLYARRVAPLWTTSASAGVGTRQVLPESWEPPDSVIWSSSDLVTVIVAKVGVDVADFRAKRDYGRSASYAWDDAHCVPITNAPIDATISSTANTAAIESNISLFVGCLLDPSASVHPLLGDGTPECGSSMWTVKRLYILMKSDNRVVHDGP